MGFVNWSFFGVWILVFGAFNPDYPSTTSPSSLTYVVLIRTTLLIYSIDESSSGCSIVAIANVPRLLFKFAVDRVP